MVIGNTLMFVVFLELRCSISLRFFYSIQIFWYHIDTNKSSNFNHLNESIEKKPYIFVLYFHLILSLHAYIRLIVDDSEK